MELNNQFLKNAFVYVKAKGTMLMLLNRKQTSMNKVIKILKTFRIGENNSIYNGVLLSH